MNKILFSKTNEPYGELSNFYYSTMIIDDKKYITNEHYYQSQKFVGTIFEEIVRTQSSPMKAKQVAWSDEAKLYIVDFWDSKKIEVMKRGLFYKFKNPILKNLLLSTENTELIEYSYKDRFWGQNEKGEGQNMLGKLLMELRKQLLEKNTFI